MSGRHEAESLRWFREADQELDIARHILGEPTLPPRAACFHAHLAAEKALKAALVAAVRPVPKLHELAELSFQLPLELQAGFDRQDLEALTPWAIAGRYPDDLLDADAETASSLIEAASRVLAAAREAIA